eukprot:scaffold56674_cov66-Phaeocystis_antarctica.AAC.1
MHESVAARWQRQRPATPAAAATAAAAAALALAAALARFRVALEHQRRPLVGPIIDARVAVRAFHALALRAPRTAIRVAPILHARDPARRHRL